MRRFCLYIALALGALGGCTLSPRDTGKAYMFPLSPIHVIRQGQEEKSLVVALPVTSSELDTYRIALLRDGGVWDYYAGARWAAFLPSLAQDTITKSLDGTQLYRAVTTDETGLRGDRILKTEIRSFQAVYKPGDSVPVIRIRALFTLLNRADRAKITSFSANAEKKAAGYSLAEIQAAFDAAFKEIQLQLVEQLKE